MQNKNLRKALLASLGVFGSLASSFANAAEVVSANKASDKAISGETNKQLKFPEEKEKRKEIDKKSDSLKAATDIKEKIGSGNLAKLLVGAGGAVLGAAAALGGKILYDTKIKDQSDKLLLNWDTKQLLEWVQRAYVTEDCKTLDSQLITSNDNSAANYRYALKDNELYRREIYKKPEVISLCNALYRLYIQLLGNDKIKGLTFTNIYGINEEDDRKENVLKSVRNLIGETENDNGHWKVWTTCKGHQTLWCGMPNNTNENPEYKITETIKDNGMPIKIVKYTATFKKTNGVFSFEKVEFIE